MRLGVRARIFVGFVCTVGLACLAWGLAHWSTTEPLLFGVFVVLVAIASGLKVVMPGFESTVSVSFVFFLMSIGTLSLSETLILGVTAATVQCYWKKSANLRFIHFVFNISQVSAALFATFTFYHRLMQGRPLTRIPLALLLACLVYFFLNTAPVAGVVSLSERKPFLKKWYDSYAWTSLSYLIGAAIAGIILMINQRFGWELSVLITPAIYALFRTYSVHIGKLESHAKHLQEMADLHLRTVEALALAIEAKDHTTGDHLQRVQVYAIELAKDLGVNESDINALRAASVLHDIGKLAVPEHIICKPGKLTPEEFERMKIHPIVGAEILEQVRFPYAVVPIVRSHHEKWDGTGYPDGLQGEQIPIGARILAAVDCLDALASDRQYRRALPLEEAMLCVAKEAGKSFDPRVVAALNSRYIELERLAKQRAPEERPKLSLDAKVDRGGAPAAGYAESRNEATAAPSVSSQAWTGTTPHEDLSVIAVQLRDSIRYDALAVYGLSGNFLRTEFALGVQMNDLKLLSIPKGTGLVGWVAETGQAILNGNPQVETGFVMNADGLCCAAAIPIAVSNRTVGVIAIYACRAGAFSGGDLEILRKSTARIGATLSMPHANSVSDQFGQNNPLWSKLHALVQ